MYVIIRLSRHVLCKCESTQCVRKIIVILQDRCGIHAAAALWPVMNPFDKSSCTSILVTGGREPIESKHTLTSSRRNLSCELRQPAG